MIKIQINSFFFKENFEFLRFEEQSIISSELRIIKNKEFTAR